MGIDKIFPLAIDLAKEVSICRNRNVANSWMCGAVFSIVVAVAIGVDKGEFVARFPFKNDFATELADNVPGSAFDFCYFLNVVNNVELFGRIWHFAFPFCYDFVVFSISVFDLAFSFYFLPPLYL